MTKQALLFLAAALTFAVSVRAQSDPDALLRQAAALEAQQQWANAADTYGKAAGALATARRIQEAANTARKVSAMARQAVAMFQRSAAEYTKAASDFEQYADALLRVTPNPPVAVAQAAPTQAVPAEARPVQAQPARAAAGIPVTIPKGVEFMSTRECTPGRAVTVAANLPYDEGGPAVVVRQKDELVCAVTMTNTGKQNDNVVYWRMAAQGAAAHYPDRIAPGNYGCVTWVGRVEVRPLYDVRVTGPNSYTGSDGSRGTFAYNKTNGEVRFSGGSHNGWVASFLDNGGQGKFVFRGESGSIDCGL